MKTLYTTFLAKRGPLGPGIFTFVLFSLLSFNITAQNNALNFSGTQDIAINYNAALDFSQNSVFSVEGWFKTTDYITVLISNKVDTSPFTGWEVSCVYNKFVFEITNDYINSALRVETVANFNDGNWHHFAVVYKAPNANSVDLFVDGTLQPKNISTNNLSSSPVTSNPLHIGSRNGTTYFLNGSLDEIRIWNKALCASEITARKNCQLTGNENGLLAYYSLNQGVPGGNNSTITTLTDNSGHNNTGTLNNFALTGTVSNWVASTTGVNGTCSYAGPITIAGTTSICIGSSNILTANGATSYTWNTSSNSSTISVTPTVTTTYSVNGVNSSSGCNGISTFTQVVLSCSGIVENTGKNELVVFPNPGTGVYFISGLETGAEIQIFNSLGQLIYGEKTSGDKTQVDLSQRNGGVYILKYSIAGNNYTRKIIKE